jgi:hypothetical protein
MLGNAKSVRTTAGWKAAVAVFAGMAALSVAGAAQADNWKKHRHHHHHYYDEPEYVVVQPRYRPPRTVYVVPQPVMVYPQPYSYGPAYPPSVNFNFSVPLR